MEERQVNYTFSESFELPSQGKIYDVPVSATVELRSMTGREEMRRLSPSATPLKTLADIIEGCMIEKPAVHVYDMAVGDYEFLLHKLRIVTYGGDYKMAIVCPHCGLTVDSLVKLEDLNIKEFDIEKFEELKTVTLPRTGKTVTLNIKTPRQIDEANQKAKDLKRKYKDANMDFDLLNSLILGVDAVDGEKLNGFEKENFVSSLPALDLRKLSVAIDELSNYIGIDTHVEVDCPACGGTVKTFFRFGPEFFGPTNL